MGLCYPALLLSELRQWNCKDRSDAVTRFRGPCSVVADKEKGTVLKCSFSHRNGRKWLVSLMRDWHWFPTPADCAPPISLIYCCVENGPFLLSVLFWATDSQCSGSCGLSQPVLTCHRISLDPGSNPLDPGSNPHDPGSNPFDPGSNPLDPEDFPHCDAIGWEWDRARLKAPQLSFTLIKWSASYSCVNLDNDMLLIATAMEEVPMLWSEWATLLLILLSF